MRYNNTNQIWFKETKDKKISIGLTDSFVDLLKECFHIIPSRLQFIKENSPLFSVETNTELFSINSPCSGILTYFNEKALRYPDKIDQEDCIFVIDPNSKEQKANIIIDNVENLQELASHIRAADRIFATPTVPPRPILPARNNVPPRPILSEREIFNLTNRDHERDIQEQMNNPRINQMVRDIDNNTRRINDFDRDVVINDRNDIVPRTDLLEGWTRA